MTADLRREEIARIAALRKQPPTVLLPSVDGFTALSIVADLGRRPEPYRAGWWAGYVIGRATEKDEATERRSRARGAGRPR